MSWDVFKRVDWTINQLINDISADKIALPDLQRPYVWDRARVRDLFDSLFRGYPTGLLLFLENETEQQKRSIGRKEDLKRIPNYVVIDGQQRLTSLYAVFTWYPVLKENKEPEVIVLSFNPLTAEFSVADASTEKGYDWIYDIKEILSGENLFNITSDYLRSFKERYGDNPEVERVIANNIQRLCNLWKQAFTVMEISKDLRIEEVSDIFLRINSRGKVLNNSDFILTLMSVYREGGRVLIEEFSEATRRRNDIADLNADDVMRVLVGVGFKRARLEDVYNFLKAQTHEFENLNTVIESVVNLQNWRNFLTILKDAWFISKELVSQKTLLIACYIFYLIGHEEYHLSFQELAPILRIYYVAMFISQKYSKSSAESTLSKDFQSLQKVKTKEEFVAFLQEEIDLEITPDIWTIRFPKDMDSTSIRSPLFIAFTAAQIYFQSPILFRNIPLSKYFIDLKGIFIIFFQKITLFLSMVKIRLIRKKLIRLLIEFTPIIAIIELFQIRLLKSIYSSFLKAELWIGAKTWNKTQFLLILISFLMKIILKKYFEQLKNPNIQLEKVSLKEKILIGENNTTEFKSSYKRDVRNQQVNDALKFQIIKTIAAFLNTDWWTLYVGVADDGTLLWLEHDISCFAKGLDGLLLDIDNLTKTHFNTSYALITVNVEMVDEKQILVFEVKAAKKPVYFTYQGKEEFYIRKAAGSLSLTIGEATNYIQDHFSYL